MAFMCPDVPEFVHQMVIDSKPHSVWLTYIYVRFNIGQFEHIFTFYIYSSTPSPPSLNNPKCTNGGTRNNLVVVAAAAVGIGHVLYCKLHRSVLRVLFRPLRRHISLQASFVDCS